MIAFNIIAFDSFDKNLSLWSSEFLKMFSLEEYYCHKYGAISLNVEYVLGHDNVHKENSSSFRGFRGSKNWSESYSAKKSCKIGSYLFSML